jgi:hypothetical protein
MPAMKTPTDFKKACAALAAAFAGVCGALAGCEEPQILPEQFVPPSAMAQEALDSTLEAWQTGAAPAPVDGGARTVQVADTHRTPGQTLASYKILGETAVDGGRRFVVRLELENPAAAENARFVVVGIDPLWVFRQEDYDMIAHWDHPMPAEEAAPPEDTESSRRVETESNND